MSKPQSGVGNQRQLLAILAGRPCPVCSDGELERGEYKDNAAAICDECGTPQAQVWRPSE
ncbi:HVO_A0556 family zinc finger protein [Natronococcus occultus]|uniref:HVO_A0556 family zinc finger protein n=1 Tax=Natronococcus occultus TaxID=29288 RepID=UPI000677C723|nr:HVO_A0556 family zinc finger protein [Natronococcus occultus]